jgi:predicted permease
MAFRALFARGVADARLDDELGFHLEQQIAENIAAGMSAEEARYAALRSFGNPALLREQSRSTWSWGGIEAFIHDARFVSLSIGRRPGFAFTVVGTLALGIGAAAAMFTVVDHVLLRPVPYLDADRLVTIQETDGSTRNWEAPWIDIDQWRVQSRSFSQIEFSGKMSGRNFLEGPDAALEVSGQRVSPGLFGMLGVAPALGSGFVSEFGKNAGAIMLSDTVWKEVFAGDRRILGKAVKINNDSYTVAGVMPPGFRYPAGISLVPQVWVPIELSSGERTRDTDKAMQFTAIARLRPGLNVEQARAEMLLVQKRLAAQYANDVLRHDHASLHVEIYAETLVGKDVRNALLALLAASGVLWLIASLNATNLFLARNTSQQRESAMRMALGASRWRLMQQTLVEGLILSGLAVLLGVGLAMASVRFLAHELSQTLPVPAPATLDEWVLLALAGLTVLTTLVATAGPALLAACTLVAPAIKQGGMQTGSSRRQNRMRGALVAGEIALSLTLIATCGLLLRTIYTLHHVPLGFRTDHIVVAHLSIPSYRFKGRNMTDSLYMPLLDRVQHLHGVESAGLMSEAPLAKTFVLHLELAMNGKTTHAYLKAVTPDLQKIFGFHMAAGRFFLPQDTAISQPVIVVNMAYARQHSPDPHNPLAILGYKLLSLIKGGPQMTIIGVIDDERQDKVAEPAVPEVELALPQITPESGFYQPVETVAMDLALRTDQPMAAIVPELRTVLKQASPELQNATITTMDQIVEDSYGSQRLAAHLLEIFGASALVLCMAGLYGLLAYVVSQRTRELGVRIALGASRGNLLWMVIRQAGVMLLAGLVIGAGLSFASGKLVARFLYGVSVHDGWTMVAAPALLVATGLLAAYLPARRAANTDPMEALRAE